MTLPSSLRVKIQIDLINKPNYSASSPTFCGHAPKAQSLREAILSLCHLQHAVCASLSGRQLADDKSQYGLNGAKARQV